MLRNWNAQPDPAFWKRGNAQLINRTKERIAQGNEF